MNKEDVDCDEDIFDMSKKGNGDLVFEVKYYNGGRSFDEAIEEAFDISSK